MLSARAGGGPRTDAMSASLRALIFDVDGTLADTERDGHRVAFNRAFADEGLSWHWDVGAYGHLLQVAGGRERLLHFLADAVPAWSPGEREALAEQLHRRKTAHYLDLVEGGVIAWRPGIVALLEEAHAAGVTLAIATTTTRANVLALFEQAGRADLLAAFAVIGSAENSARKKPDPGIYHHVLERLQLPAGHCLAIEDSRAGLLAARAAGIPTVVTFNDYTRGEDFDGALRVLPSLLAIGDPAGSVDDAPPERLVGLPELRRWWAEAPH